jgi:hypothetical protein
MWSTHANWLQHLPALPILLLKFSFPHNFWSLGQKLWNLYSRKAYSKAHVYKKFQKNLKKKWHQVMLPKLPIVPRRDNSPLGIKVTVSNLSQTSLGWKIGVHLYDQPEWVHYLMMRGFYNSPFHMPLIFQWVSSEVLFIFILFIYFCKCQVGLNLSSLLWFQNVGMPLVTVINTQTILTQNLWLIL